MCGMWAGGMNEKAMDEAERRLTARRLVQGTEAQTGAGEIVNLLGRGGGRGRRGEMVHAPTPTDIQCRFENIRLSLLRHLDQTPQNNLHIASLVILCFRR